MTLFCAVAYRLKAHLVELGIQPLNTTFPLREFLIIADAFGAIAGFLIFGRLSDRHGRKKVLMSCSVCSVLFALLDAFSPVYTVFFVGRLFLGAFDAGIFVSSLVLFVGKYTYIPKFTFRLFASAE